MKNSCIYQGRLSHRRETPREHEFSYSLFMVYLDLAELDEVFRGRWLWSAKSFNLATFRRSDHLGAPDQPLFDCALDLVESRLGSRPAGPVRLLTNLRYFGLGMNPVSFYYCFDGDKPHSVIAEINNTPWREQFCYVVPWDGSGRKETFAKAFHVSPFMPMNQEYEWQFSLPERKLFVGMHNTQEEHTVFRARLSLERKDITASNLALALLRHPCMTASVALGIYWQALRLWLKRTPFFNHP